MINNQAKKGKNKSKIRPAHCKQTKKQTKQNKYKHKNKIPQTNKHLKKPETNTLLPWHKILHYR